MSIRILKNGEVVSTSKNLRGIFRYRSPVKAAYALTEPDNTGLEWPTCTRGVLAVAWHDKAESIISFASHKVLVEFLNNRRSWKGVRHIGLNGEPF